MRITFVLPAPVRIPMGGAAVVYRHAEALSELGHEVTIAEPRRGGGELFWAARSLVAGIRDRWHGLHGQPPVYTARGVSVKHPARVSAATIPDADAVIATGFQTVPWVASLPDRHGTKLYFIQHDERHLGGAAAQATWDAPFGRIPVARWIETVLETAGYPCLGVVPNAIDPERFALDVPLTSRPRRVVALYHRLPSKGPDVLIAALEKLRERLPDMQADVIASRTPTHRLPSWVTVHVRAAPAALRALYNRSAVVLHTSRLEGWGLVPMEAAACGCAVVATASRGVNEYLDPGVSMRQVPVDDIEGLAREAAHLLEDDTARVALAEAAMASVATFRWADSHATFERLIREAVAA